MRRKVRNTIWTLITAAVLLYGAVSWLRTAIARLELPGTDQPATRSQTYLIQPDRWTEFAIPSSGNMLRILTNANLRSVASVAETPVEGHPGWSYAITLQFLDSRGDVLDERDYHCRTRADRYRNAATGEVFSARFYAGESLLPCKTQELRYPLARLDERATRVRVRLAEYPPQCQDVGVRVYCLQEQADYSRRYRWQRTSRRKREKLCKASVYAPDLISRHEQQNLLRWQWSPLAPQGIEGRDYDRRVLVTLKEIDGQEVGLSEDPAGMLVNHSRRGVVPLPVHSGWVRLQVRFPTATDVSQHATQLEVRWFGKGIDRRSQRVFSITRDGGEVAVPVEGGLLELASPNMVFVRAFWSATAPSDTPYAEDITPKERRALTYVTDSSRVVEYDIHHVNQQPTPFKIILRHLLSEHAGNPPTTKSVDAPGVSCQLIDAAGEVVAESLLTSDQPCSLYDRAQDPHNGGQVSEPATYHFSLDAEVRRVRLRAVGQPVLVAAYSRPWNVVRTTFVPEDYSAFHHDRDRRRTWFQLRPSGHWELMEQMRAEPLAVQPRPPQSDPALLAGHYEWEDYHPQGPWAARRLLIPHEAQQPARRSAAAVVYCQLAAGQNHRVNLLPAPGRRRVTPSLIYCRDEAHSAEDPRPLEIQVIVAGRLLKQIRVFGTQGELLLPPLLADEPSRTTDIRIQTDGPARLFLNHVRCAGKSYALKRLANRFDERRVSFKYAKKSTGRELLRLQFYCPPYDAGRRRLEVTVEPPLSRRAGPHQDWTVLRRVFDMMPPGSPDIPVIGGNPRQTSEAQTCFLPLGSDLPPGEYTIHVSRPAGPGGYLVLSKTTPGADNRPRIFTEPHGENDARPNED